MPSPAKAAISREGALGSKRWSMRSRAVILPLACCFSMFFLPPPSFIRAKRFRSSDSSNLLWSSSLLKLMSIGCPLVCLAKISSNNYYISPYGNEDTLGHRGPGEHQLQIYRGPEVGG